MNARTYDPKIGRVMSADLVVADPTSSQAWNGYTYANNSPLVFKDPSGWQAVPVQDLGGQIPQGTVVGPGA